MSITELKELNHAPASALYGKITKNTATVGVVGLGYVGLPLAVEQAKAGYHVVGYDLNAIRVAQVNQGLNYIRDVDDEELARVVTSERLIASDDLSTLGARDIIIICVPTPLTLNKDPNLSHIRGVGEEIARSLRRGQLVCLESTTFPGTTEEILLPQLVSGGLKVGTDFFLSYSPERVDPGNKRFATKNTPKLVSGVTDNCLRLATEFYKQTISEVKAVSSPRVAEMAKIYENTFRSVNIALVNEIALLCDRMRLNMWDVLDAATTKPFGIMRFDPGPGVGGHCIPLDPIYLAWKAREYDFSTRFIDLAGEINNFMPYFVRDKLARVLNTHGRPLQGSRILMIGLAYKKDVSDWRESPALKVLELLAEAQAVVTYHDPLVPSFQDEREGVRHSTLLTARTIAESDCVLITTDHSEINWSYVVDNARLVLDTRNATKEVTRGRDRVVLL